MKTKIALAALVLSLSTPSMAAYTVTIKEVDGDVVATGTGTLHIGSAIVQTIPLVVHDIDPSQARILLSGSNSHHYIVPSSFSGPSNFGVGVSTPVTSGSGHNVGIQGDSRTLYIPPGYVSDDLLNSSATWSGHTFASLGVTPGTYEWTWGTGATADKFIVEIVATPTPVSTTSIPTLSEWGLIGMSSLLAMLGISRMRRRKIESN